MEVDSAFWRIAGKSTRGATHVRNGKPNQDAVLATAIRGKDETTSEQRYVVAVADGHGSSKYFRSDIGARLAVDAVADVLTKHGSQGDAGALDSESLKALSEWYTDRLAGLVVHRWRQLVKGHLEAHPFSEDERSYLGNRSISNRQQFRNRPSNEADGTDFTDFVAYGSTLAFVEATERYLAIGVLGDSDIVMVYEDGTAVDVVEAPSHIGEETESLCQAGAEHKFHVRFIPLEDDASDIKISMVFASSDGFANSYPSQSSFHQTCAQYWFLVAEHGLDAVADKLSDWLEETTNEGSGDDVTIGLLHRVGSVLKPKALSRTEELAAIDESPTELAPVRKIPNEHDDTLMTPLESQKTDVQVTDFEPQAISNISFFDLVLPTKVDKDPIE